MSIVVPVVAALIELKRKKVIEIAEKESEFYDLILQALSEKRKEPQTTAHVLTLDHLVSVRQFPTLMPELKVKSEHLCSLKTKCQNFSAAFSEHRNVIALIAEIEKKPTSQEIFKMPQSCVSKICEDILQ